jgi:uncharacterized protein
MSWFIEKGGEIILSIRVIPRASRSELVGIHDGAVKVRLSSPPVDGAANAELIKLLAKSLGVPKSAIEIVSGQASKTKSVRVTGISTEALKAAIGE